MKKKHVVSLLKKQVTELCAKACKRLLHFHITYCPIVYILVLSVQCDVLDDLVK